MLQLAARRWRMEHTQNVALHAAHARRHRLRSSNIAGASNMCAPYRIEVDLYDVSEVHIERAALLQCSCRVQHEGASAAVGRCLAYPMPSACPAMQHH